MEKTAEELAELAREIQENAYPYFVLSAVLKIGFFKIYIL
jgi:hypothetical protein